MDTTALAPESDSLESTAPASAPDPVETALAPSLKSGSLKEFRAAEAELAKNPPSLKAETAPAQPERQTSKRQQQINDYERTNAELRERLARLEGQVSARPVDTPSAPAQPVTPPTPKDYQRYRAMPDAPKESEFTDYGDFSAALAVFIADTRAEERSASTRDVQQRAEFVKEDQKRAQQMFERVTKALPDLPKSGEFQTPQDYYDAMHTRYGIGQDVLLLRPLSQLRPGESPTVRNVIAEEIRESEYPHLMMRALSKPGELDRFSRMDPRTFTKEITRLHLSFESAAASAKPITSMPAPSTTLTASGSTESADPSETAVKRGDMRAFKAAERAKYLRAQGKG